MSLWIFLFPSWCLRINQTEVSSRVRNSLKGGEGGKSGCYGDGAEVPQGPLRLVENAQHAYCIARRRRRSAQGSGWSAATPPSWLFKNVFFFFPSRSEGVKESHGSWCCRECSRIHSRCHCRWEGPKKESHSWATREFNIVSVRERERERERERDGAALTLNQNLQICDESVGFIYSKAALSVTIF